MSVLFNKVLITLPNDNSQADMIAKVGLAIAQSHHADARLISIVRPVVPITTIPPTPAPASTVNMTMSDTELEQREATLNALIEKHNPRDSVDHVVKKGVPSDEIENEAETWGADLIILGSREKNWLERLIDPAVSQQVMRRANCAVMVLPATGLKD